MGRFVCQVCGVKDRAEVGVVRGTSKGSEKGTAIKERRHTCEGKERKDTVEKGWMRGENKWREKKGKAVNKRGTIRVREGRGRDSEKMLARGRIR